MTEEERDDLIDLLPRSYPIWEYEDEIPGHTTVHDIAWWRNILGHPKSHPGCCKTCGCCTTCMFSLFHGAMVDSVVRELDRIGALRKPDDV